MADGPPLPRRLTEAELQVALGLVEGPAHGYLLMRRVGDAGQGAGVGAATMYRTLGRLLGDGLVVETGPSETDRRRRTYRLTESGLQALAAEGRRMAALIGMAVARGVPERFHTITPQIVVAGADGAIAFYREAFGARLLVRTAHPSGRVVHAELSIGDSLLLLHDDFSDLGGPAAPGPGGAGLTIHLYVADPDAVMDRAVAAGARAVLAMGERPWGDQYGIVEDPYHHRWSIAAPGRG